VVNASHLGIGQVACSSTSAGTSEGAERGTGWLVQLWPWLLVITGYFYGIIHSINGVISTYNWSMAISVWFYI
jgi:hypothetical protein